MQNIRDVKSRVGKEAAKARADVESMGKTLLEMHQEVVTKKNEVKCKDRDLKKKGE